MEIFDSRNNHVFAAIKDRLTENEPAGYNPANSTPVNATQKILSKLKM